MASVWMHNGFLLVQNEKMSKSLGNFFTIDDVLKVFDAEVVRFFLLRGHYRSPLNYTDAHLEDARQALNTLYTALRGRNLSAGAIDWSDPAAQQFKEAMDDDLNTSEAVAVLFGLARDANRALSDSSASDAAATQWFRLGGADAARIEALIAERKAARWAKNFAESDRIRDALLAEGVTLEDGPLGTTWRRG